MKPALDRALNLLAAPIIHRAPTPDLGAQGEPVAEDLWRWIEDRRKCAQSYLDLCECNRADNPYERGRMSLLTELTRFLKEAPAAPRTGSGVSVGREAVREILGRLWCFAEGQAPDDAISDAGHTVLCATLGGLDPRITRQIDEHADLILALIAQAPRDGGETRGGWRLVPEEPTEDMAQAGWIDKEDVDPDDIYRAMLAAAPTPPSGVETIRRDNEGAADA